MTHAITAEDYAIINAILGAVFDGPVVIEVIDPAAINVEGVILRAVDVKYPKFGRFTKPQGRAWDVTYSSYAADSDDSDIGRPFHTAMLRRAVRVVGTRVAHLRGLQASALTPAPVDNHR